MKYRLLIGALSLSLFSFAAHAGSVNIDVKLKPAGSFVAKTDKVKGQAIKVGSGVKADNISVDLNSLTTGIELRDKHLKERLLTSKYPEAKLVTAQGKDGKGTATLVIKGMTKEVAGTYKIAGSQLTADFEMNLPDLQITGVKYMGVGVQDKVMVHITVPVVEGK